MEWRPCTWQCQNRPYLRKWGASEGGQALFSVQWILLQSIFLFIHRRRWQNNWKTVLISDLKQKEPSSVTCAVNGSVLLPLLHIELWLYRCSWSCSDCMVVLGRCVSSFHHLQQCASWEQLWTCLVYLNPQTLVQVPIHIHVQKMFIAFQCQSAKEKQFWHWSLKGWRREGVSAVGHLFSENLKSLHALLLCR